MVYIPQYQQSTSAPFAPGGQVGVDDSVGRAVEDLGAAGQRVWEQQSDTLHEDQARAALEELGRRQQKLMFGDGGYVHAEGQNAIDQAEPTLAQAQKDRDEIAAGLSSPSARRMFDQLAAGRMESFRSSVDERRAQGQDFVTDENDKATILSAASSFKVAVVKDPAKAGELSAQYLAVTDRRLERSGLKPGSPAFQAAHEEARLALLTGAIADAPPAMARKLASDFGDKLTDAGKATLEKVVKARETTAISDAVVGRQPIGIDAGGDPARAAAFAAPGVAQPAPAAAAGKGSPGKGQPDKGQKAGAPSPAAASPYPIEDETDDYGLPTYAAADARARRVAQSLGYNEDETKALLATVHADLDQRQRMARSDGEAAHEWLMERRGKLRWEQIPPDILLKLPRSELAAVAKQFGKQPPTADDLRTAVTFQQLLSTFKGRAKLLEGLPFKNADKLMLQTFKQQRLIVENGRAGDPRFEKACQAASASQAASYATLKLSGVALDHPLALRLQYLLGRWVAHHADKHDELPSFEEINKQGSRIMAMEFHALQAEEALDGATADDSNT